MNRLGVVVLNRLKYIEAVTDAKPGEDVLIPLSMSSEEARAHFPKGFAARTPYFRVTPDPNR